LLLLGLAGLTCPGLTGCTSLLTPGDTVAAHARGHAEEPGTAPSDGRYVLMHKYVDGSPLVTTSLSRGDRLGFATDQTGQITAVAGDDEWIYTDNDYVWVRRR
jgi:hypothetical protein